MKVRQLDRGGDASKGLVGSLEEDDQDFARSKLGHEELRLLEVGALRVDNACARSGWFKMEQIDVHSQHRLIKEPDFMQIPIPVAQETADDGFDIVSLRLVVNFVADAAGRGAILSRVSSFFRNPNRQKKKK